MLNTFPLTSFNTQSPLSHSLFRSNFTNNLKTYKKLGQFSYDQHHCIIDHIHTYIKGENGHNARWIYIGNVKEGTDDIPHGIGIQVWDYGGTQLLNDKV